MMSKWVLGGRTADSLDERTSKPLGFTDQVQATATATATDMAWSSMYPMTVPVDDKIGVEAPNVENKIGIVEGHLRVILTETEVGREGAETDGEVGAGIGTENRQQYLSTCVCVHFILCCAYIIYSRGNFPKLAVQ